MNQHRLFESEEVSWIVDGIPLYALLKHYDDSIAAFVSGKPFAALLLSKRTLTLEDKVG